MLAVLLPLAAGCMAAPVGQDEPSDQRDGATAESNASPPTLQALVRRLESEGAEVKVKDRVEQPFFAVPGTMIGVNGDDIQIFEYSSEAARREQSEMISSDGRTIGTSKPLWIGTPRFWASGRILVLYVGKDQSVLRHLQAALGPPTAGPGI